MPDLMNPGSNGTGAAFSGLACGVTGGSGNIGRRLAAALCAQGAGRVCSISRHGKVDSASALPGVAVLQGDIQAPDSLAPLFQGLDIVFHAAGISDARKCADDPLGAFRVNAYGTAVVREACHRAGVKRLVYLSTGHVYGPKTDLPAREGDVACPVSVYGATKLAGEVYLQSLASTSDLQCDIVRISNVYGGDISSNTVIGRIVSQALARNTVNAYNVAAQRDFIHIDDVVEGLLRVAVAEHEKDAAQVLNLSPGKPSAVHEVIRIVASIVKRTWNCELRFNETGESYDDFFYMDNARLEELTRWTPSIGLKEGIERTWRLHQHQQRVLGCEQ